MSFVRARRTISQLLVSEYSFWLFAISLTGCAKATLYSETYTLKHCGVFLCYYIFTASIMHVTSREYPSLGLPPSQSTNSCC
jgi:hypothetical protein